MELQPRSQYNSAMTGNAGLNYAAWQLSRRGWHVMPTIRNARGSDLFVTNDDESIFFGVQSKGLSRRSPVPLGRASEPLRSDWWIITINAVSEDPTCYILRNTEVEALASVDKNGAGGRWLEPRAYTQDAFKDAWERLQPSLPGIDEKPRPSPAPRRPEPDSLCGRAWALFDRLAESSASPIPVKSALEAAKLEGLHPGNVRTEFYRWRAFNAGKGQ